MKRRDSRPLRTIGSLSLCRSLLRAGVVDRFRVVGFPVITGATGKDRVFDGYPDIALDLVESRTFDGRLQLLEYVPTVGDSQRRTLARTDLGYIPPCASDEERRCRPCGPRPLFVPAMAEPLRCTAESTIDDMVNPVKSCQPLASCLAP